MLQHGQCWQQEQQTASAPNQIHGQADSHCLVPHKWGEGHWFQIHPSAAGTVGTAMIHGAGTARLESGGVTGMGPAGSRSEDRVLVLGGRLRLWIHQVHSSSHLAQRLHQCLQTRLSRHHSPRQVPGQQRLLHWVRERDGARQELDSPQPTTAARACQSSSVVDNALRHMAIFCVVLCWARAWT